MFGVPGDFNLAFLVSLPSPISDLIKYSPFRRTMWKTPKLLAGSETGMIPGIKLAFILIHMLLAMS